MLCNRCNKNEARVHLVKMVNGKKTETWLCEKCAKEISSGALIPIMNESTEESIAKGLESLLNDMTKERKEFSPKIDIICKNCGLTLSKFKKNGKLGCSECYNSFSDELENLMIEFQGSNSHIGKMPKREANELNKFMEINNLKQELKKAIEMEEYELAATLRDKLKIIKGEFYNNEKLDV